MLIPRNASNGPVNQANSALKTKELVVVRDVSALCIDRSLFDNPFLYGALT